MNKREGTGRVSGGKAAGIRWGLAVAAVALGCVGPLQAGHRLVRSPASTDPMPVSIYRLDNGLTVYLTEHREEPRFYAEIAIRAGSKHDPAESTGLAHYLEHLLFKGSRRLGTLDFEKEKPHLDRIDELYELLFAEKDPEKRKAIYTEINRETLLSARYSIPNEMDRLYKSMGEQGLNAHTSNEETVYKVDLPVNRLEQWALIESDRFLQPVFRLFQPELEIVYEEMNRMLDSKEAILMLAVERQLFKKHPYGQQTTIGTPEHLKNPSLKNVRRFYETYYVPNNMGIFVSGDLNTRRTIRLIDQYFSSWQAQPLPEPKRWTEDPLAGPERLTVRYKGEEMVRLAFRMPGRSDPDADALKLADMILDNATAGLINLNLNQKQRVRRAGSGLQLHNDYGAEYLWGVPKKGQSLDEVEQLLLEQVELLKRGEFEDWILPAVVAEFKKSRKLMMESNESRVAWMRDSFIGLEDWDWALGDLDRLSRVTKADVVRVANRYLGSNYVAGRRIDEQHDVVKLEKPPIEPVPIEAQRESAFAREILARQVPPLEPVFLRANKDYREKRWTEGVDVRYCPNPVNDLFVLTVGIDLGTRHDPRLGTALRFLDRCGTRRLSPEQVKKEWYKLATDFNVSAAENELQIQISGLDENLEASLALMGEVLRDVVVAPAVLEEFKRILLAQREDTKKEFAAIAGALALYNRYGENSPYRRVLSNDALRALTGEELRALIAGLLDYRLTVHYTGSQPQKKVEALLKARLSQTAARTTPPDYVFLRAAAPEKHRIYFTHKEQAQAQVRIEFADGQFNELDFPAVQLFNDYFGGGMAGIVFQELREARALAYSVGAVYGMGSRLQEQNLVTGGIGTQADKTVDALTAFLKLFDELPQSPERFIAAKDSILNTYRTTRVGFRSVLGVVEAWERLGLPVDPRKARYQKVLNADLPLVMGFHADRLRNRPKLISIVGDRSRINLEALKQLGDVRELAVDDLFGF